MRVVHEAPHKDLSFFARAPLRLHLSDTRVVTFDAWSVSGLRKPDALEVSPRRGVLEIPFQGIDLRFPVELDPDATGTFLRFKGLTVRQKETLSLFHANLLAGKMAATDEMITALDTPVDLVPMSETSEETAAATANGTPRAWRVLKALASYVAAAVLVFGFLGQSVATRLLTIPAVQARVVAPMTPHLSTASAHVDRIDVAVGEAVVQGQTLIRMSDPRREGRLDDARRALQTREAAVTSARAVLRKHDATQDAVRATLATTLAQALAREAHPGIVAPSEAVRRARAALAAFDAGLRFAEGDFFDLRADLVAARDARKEEVRQAKRALGIAKADARLLDIKAHVDGTVRALSAVPDTAVSRGTVLANIEAHAPRVVRAWVDETHLSRLWSGSDAALTVPGLGRTEAVTGRVTEVVAGIDDSAAKRGFGLIVTVAVDASVTLAPGMPVGLRIWRGWVPDWARF